MKRTEHSGRWLRMQSALLLCGAAVLYANAELLREGRPIQCDGFLLEWKAADAQSMGTDSGPRWDAIRTTDGIAGYVHFTADSARCAAGGVKVLVERDGGPDIFTLSLADSGSDQPYHAVGTDARSGQKVLEFMFAWERLPSGCEQTCRMQLIAVDTCGAVIGAVTVRAERSITGPSGFPARFYMRLAIIAVLLTAYIVIQIRLRAKRTRQTQSLRQ